MLVYTLGTLFTEMSGVTMYLYSFTKLATISGLDTREMVTRSMLISLVSLYHDILLFNPHTSPIIYLTYLTLFTDGIQLQPR